MAGIESSIVLHDGFSNTLEQLNGELTASIGSMQSFQATLGQQINTTAMDSAAQAANDTASALEDLQATAQAVDGTKVNIGVAEPEMPQAPQTAPTITPAATTQAVNVQAPVQTVESVAPAENPAITAQPNAPPTARVETPSPVTVPVTPEVTEQPKIDVPEDITVPVTPEVTEQPQIDTPDDLTVPVTPEVTQQPEIDVPDALTVPVTPDVTAQPEIDTPDQITVPVEPVVTDQPQIDVPDGIDVPVTPIVTEQPQIDVPDGITVPVTAEIVSQPEIDVPDMIKVPVKPEAMGTVDLDIPDQVTVPVVPEVQNQATIDVLDSSVSDQVTELQNALQTVLQTQQQINQQASGLQIVPPSARKDLADLNNQVTQMSAQMDFLADNSVDMDTTSAQAQIDQLTAKIQQAEQAQEGLSAQLQATPSVPPTPPQPTVQPVTIPVHWETDPMPTFDTTGIGRWKSEATSANEMMQTLASEQTRIAQQAYSTALLPNNAAQDLLTLSNRMDSLQQKIQQINANKINATNPQASAQMESLRKQMTSALQTQRQLNAAMNSMDASGANAAYLQLSQQVSAMETSIRDNTNAQGSFNTEVQNGVSTSNQLLDTIKHLAATYLSMKSIKGMVDASDELVSTQARLAQMNDGVQSTQELMNAVYGAAQDARGSFSDMASVVARFGNNAKDAFSSSKEVVAFADLVQKQMTIAGASTQEAANAELQLSQALGSGVLRGDELNSIFEQAPNLIQNIADYLDVPIGKIREMAQDGDLSASVVKAAVFAASDDINAKFEKMPMTWGQVWQRMQNAALMAFQPVLQKINDLANNDAFQQGMTAAIGVLANVANLALTIFEQIGEAAAWMYNNWSQVAPILENVLIILGSIAGAVATYNAVQAIGNGIQAIHNGLAAVSAAMHSADTAATTADAAAHGALNVQLALTVSIIFAVIAAIALASQAIASMTGIASTGFGVITGGINVVIAFFRNLGTVAMNIGQGIWGAMSALASNMQTAFSNSIANIKSFFYSLMSTAASVISGIAAALNQLPFVSFDYSGISSAASDYAAKAAAAQDSKGSYKSISDAFTSSMGSDEAFSSGWVQDAFSAGAAWGDDKVAGLQDMLSGLATNADAAALTNYEIPDFGQFANDAANAIDGSDTGKNTGKIAKSLDVTDDELKYLRDIAEQEAINRFTTASVSVDMSGMTNQINNGMDIDGVVDELTTAVRSSMEEIAEGVQA